MDYMELIAKLFEIVIFPLIGAGTVYLINLIRLKSQELKDQKDNDLYQKYIDMLENTITACVLATSQTYVDELKKQGAFDIEAQKKAFKMTYDNVVKILTDDAKLYLDAAIGDLQNYITNRIEAEIKVNK